MMSSTRQEWVELLEKIALPVFTNLAAATLHETMPVEAAPGREDDRRESTHLEALGRAMAGIGPWLDAVELDAGEERKRAALAALAQQGIAHATDPSSPDYMNFTQRKQRIVDAAFLAQGLLRCWNSVWLQLDDLTKDAVCTAMRQTRSDCPGFNNWLVFAAIIEAFLCKAGQEWDRMRVDYAIRQHDQWYKGDGVYGDGQSFHWDYYNSFVIQPMLDDILRVVTEHYDHWGKFKEPFADRLRRYSAIQARMIAADGSFPPFGRSLAYRCGAFHALAHSALHHDLPEELSPAAARCALNAVIHRTLAAAANFDSDGWLRIGLCASQPGLGEAYISTGSLYLCLCAFLPLGLPPHDPFWHDPDQDWPAKRIWAGHDAANDHAIDGKVPYRPGL